LFIEETVNFSGRYYTITDMQGKPKPVQKPHPPIHLGGVGKRLLSLVAQRADSIGIGFTVWREEVTEVKPEDIARKVSWVREAAGEDFERLELGYTLYRLALTNGRTDDALPQSLHVLAGSIDHIIEVLLAQRERYGFSYIQMMEQHMEIFAPVVARLAGK
jgi:hypothetical protein